MIKKALEISQKQEDQRKQLMDQEEEMIRKAIEMSEMEERERVQKMKKNEEIQLHEESLMS